MEDIYKNFEKTTLIEYFNFSDYLKNYLLYDKTNKKVIKKFKDGLKGKIMIEFIGLKPKHYAFKLMIMKKTKNKIKKRLS